MLPVFAAGIVMPTNAHPEDVEALLSLSLEEMMRVKVTGSTLTPENLKTVPSAVTVFTHEEIQRLGVDTLDELMNLAPGFQSYRSSFAGQHFPFSSRGRRIGNPASEILILVDGQRLNDPRNSGSAIVIPRLPLMNIQRVEFIRGPGAAVYGSNAMMGVINIVTRSGENEVSAGVGSFNRRQAYLLASRQIGEVKVDLFGNMGSDSGDHYRIMDTFGSSRIDTQDPHRLADLNLKLRWQQTQLNFQHYQSSAEDFYELNGVNDGLNENKKRFSSLSLKKDINWHSVTSYVWFSYTLSNINFAAQLLPSGDLAAISNPSSNDALIIKTDFSDFSESRAQWHNDWAINSFSSLQFGIEVRHLDVPKAVTRNNFDLGDLAAGNFPIRYYGDLTTTTVLQAASRRDIVGLYVQYQRPLWASSHLTLGLRYDEFSGIGSQVSPRLGLVQELGTHHSLKLLYGEAFRSPAENELNLLNNPVLLGNPDLHPETVQTSELIWLGQWPHTSSSVGYFENRFKNSIVEVSTGTGTVQYENVDQGPSKGVEFELSHEFSDHWLLRVSYTHIRDKPDSAFREASQLASLMVNYQEDQWNANLVALYQGKREMPTGGNDSNRIVLDRYWQLIGKVIYHLNRDWQGFVQGKNLLNREYLTPAAGSTLTEGIPNRGREVLLGLSLHL